MLFSANRLLFIDYQKRVRNTQNIKVCKVSSAEKDLDFFRFLLGHQGVLSIRLSHLHSCDIAANLLLRVGLILRYLKYKWATITDVTAIYRMY